MNRESQKLVPTRNFSHLEPQKFVPANHKTSPIRKIKLRQNFHATRTVVKRQLAPGKNLAKAKFMNLKTDDEQKPSTRLLGVHIDEMLTWDNQIKHISSQVINGLRMLYIFS